MHHSVNNYRKSDWTMAQACVISFSIVKIATTGTLEATPEVSQVRRQFSVNIVTTGSFRVVQKFTPGG